MKAAPSDNYGPAGSCPGHAGESDILNRLDISGE